MATLKVNLFVSAPMEDYPLSETCVVTYLVCYISGTSLRVLLHTNDFHDASLYAQSCSKDVLIYKQVVNLQKLL